MYIQITTRCNMSCEHCCMACTAEGEDMSLDTYRNALKHSDYTISIGGGEPTLHPMFWQFLGEAIAAAYDYVWLATNGSQTDTSLALANMAKKGVIGCALSQDIYHDPIDERVVQAFTKDQHQSRFGSNDDCREIRNVTGSEINGGRCDFGRDNACACRDLHVNPDGTLRVCGCEEATVLGNVNDAELEIPEWYVYGDCYKDQNMQLS